MRITIASAAAALSLAIAAALPASAQSIPLWRFAGTQLVVPKCSAPARLTEMRDTNGRIYWRCVTPSAR